MLDSNFITKLSGQKWLKDVKNVDFSKVTYMPEFKLGKPINSGLDADVFEIQKYPDLVARVDHRTTFDTSMLKRAKENVRHIWASNADESITIMTKIKGEPLYSKNWMIGIAPDKKDYMKNLDEILDLPDSTFHNYIDEIERIRANGCRIDTINPNNILLDRANKKFNIVDIEEGKNKKNYTNIEDFYPFVDERRLIPLMKTMNPSEREVLSKKIKQFFARMEKIGNERNIDLSVEKVNHNKLQDVVTYIVYDDKSMLDCYFH